MANKTYNDHPTDNTPAAGDLIPYWDVAAGAAKKAVRSAVIGATITGAGTIATGGYTLTVPATGTAALRDVANTFTANQTVAGTLDVSGPITLNHNTPLNVKDNGGTARSALYMAPANDLIIGAGVQSGGYVGIAPGGSSKLRIYGDGKVSIGTPSPSYALDVSGDINASGSVRSNGTPLTSDARLKDDVQPLADALAKVRQARGVSFSWKNDDKDAQKHIGFVAQEIEQIFPDLVSEWVVDGETIKCVDYARMVPALLEAVKELAGRVDALQGVT